jgi:hypothetical protein
MESLDYFVLARGRAWWLYHLFNLYRVSGSATIDSEFSLPLAKAAIPP